MELIPNKRITIPFSENDLQELMQGREFNWKFIVEGGFEEVDVRIIKGEEEDLM